MDGDNGESPDDDDDDDGSQGWAIAGEIAVDRDDGLQSSDRILLRHLSSPSFTSPLMMKSFRRLTSDNFTGFNRNSSAPSSKHLLISKFNY